MTTKEDIPKRVTDPMLEQLALLMETNRKQSEIIESQAKTIEELRVTIVELNASLAWLKRKVFGKMSEKCNPINNGDPMQPARRTARSAPRRTAPSPRSASCPAAPRAC